MPKSNNSKSTMRLLFVKLELYPAALMIEQAVEKELLARQDIALKVLNMQALAPHFSATALKQGVHYSYLAALIPLICEQEKIDAVLFLEGFWLNEQPLFSILKKQGIKTIAWLTDDPYEIAKRYKIIPYLDYIFTVDASAMDYYKQLNPKATVVNLPLGAIPFKEVLPKKEPEVYDISLVGVPHLNSRRTKIINEISEYLSTKKAKIAGAFPPLMWENSLHNPELLKDQLEDRWVSLSETFYFYTHSRINLVIHRDSQTKLPEGTVDTGNPENIKPKSPCERVFNIAAAGGFQIVDNSREDLQNYFIPDKEIVIFNSTIDLKEKCEYYLNHPEERKQIALSGQKRAQEYTYKNQLDKLFNIVFAQIKYKLK